MTALRLYGKTPRCWWCGKKINGQPCQIKVEMLGKEYDAIVCSEEHERAVTDAYDYIRKVFILFPIGLIAGGLSFMASAFFHSGNIAGIFLLGVTLFVCPFATPQTVRIIGLKRSLTLGRMVGVGFCIWALVLMLVL